MANEINIYEPRRMLEVIERMPPVRTFFRDTLFTRRVTFNTKSVEVDMVKGSRQLAPFVHPRIGGKTLLNEGYQTKSYSPPMLAPDIMTTADDLLNRSPGEALYSGKSPAARAVEKLGRDLRKLEEIIARREEWMCAQVIFEGKIPIVGEGVNDVINFGFTNYENITSDPASRWNVDTSKPLEDIEKWHTAIQKDGFTNANIMIVAADVANVLINHPSMKELLDIRNYELAVIKPRQLPNGLTYVGSIHKLGLDIYQYNEWYLDDWTDPDAPKTKPLVPDGHIALLSTEALFSILYGAITLIDKKTDGFYTVEGSRIPYQWSEHKPPRKMVALYSKPLPVPHEVDSWYVAKVL